MSYYLRGGLGDAYSVPPPTYESCTPFDPACVARNQVLSEAWIQANAKQANAGHLADCLHGNYDPAPLLCAIRRRAGVGVPGQWIRGRAGVNDLQHQRGK